MAFSDVEGSDSLFGADETALSQLENTKALLDVPPLEEGTSIIARTSIGPPFQHLKYCEVITENKQFHQVLICQFRVIQCSLAILLVISSKPCPGIQQLDSQSIARPVIGPSINPSSPHLIGLSKSSESVQSFNTGVLPANDDRMRGACRPTAVFKISSLQSFRTIVCFLRMAPTSSG